MTEWRAVPGFPKYLVSDKGDVWSTHQWRRQRGRLLLGSMTTKGYPTVQIMQPGVGVRHFYRHTLVAEAFLGPRPEGLEVRHLDGNALNCSVSNLAYGTRSDNMLDMVRHGMHRNAIKTHCPKGHSYSAENTVLDASSGSRRCRICRREQLQAAEARYKARKRGVAA